MAFDFLALRKLFAGAYIANNAIEALQQGRADSIAFAKLFLANSDLVERLRRNAHLNTPKHASFYGGAAEGYTDYPTLEEASPGGEC